MEALWRTGLVCTVIVIVFATEAAGGRKEDSAQSQGEWRIDSLLDIQDRWCLFVRRTGVYMPKGSVDPKRENLPIK